MAGWMDEAPTIGNQTQIHEKLGTYKTKYVHQIDTFKQDNCSYRAATTKNLTVVHEMLDTCAATLIHEESYTKIVSLYLVVSDELEKKKVTNST